MKKIKLTLLIVFVILIGIKCKKDKIDEDVFNINQKIIMNVFPENGNTISIYDSLKVDFTLQLSTNIKDNEGFLYRAILDSFVVRKNGKDVYGEIRYSTDMKSAFFLPEKLFDINETFNISIYTHFEYCEEGGSVWKIFDADNLNNKYFGDFKTELGIINKDKVAFSYPFDRQYHFLKDESITGYLKLKEADYVFLNLKSANFIARYSSPGINDIEVDVEYDEINCIFSFPIPNTELLNENIYKLDLIQLIETRNEENLVYKIEFRTSMFNTFEEKWNSFVLNGFWSYPVMNGVHDIGVYYIGEEYFDEFEILNSVNLKGMTNNVWYQDYVYPLLYQGYPNSGIYLTRSEDPLGIPPLNCLTIINYPSTDILLTDEQIDENIAPRITDIEYVNFKYQIDYYVYYDYYDLLIQAVNHTNFETDAWMQNLADTPYPSLFAGYSSPINYDVELKYMPTPVISTFETIFSIEY